MKLSKRKVPVLYSFLYKRIRDNFRGFYLKPTEFFEILKTTLKQVPPYVRYAVLAEMENYKLIKRINRKRIRVLKSDCHKNLDKLGVRSFWE